LSIREPLLEPFRGHADQYLFNSPDLNALLTFLGKTLSAVVADHRMSGRA
jgi:hypothetical protein